MLHNGDTFVVTRKTPDTSKRGLVPSMKFTYGPFQDQILTESAVIVRFLADCHSSHLQQTNLPDPAAAFVHARVALFADVWVSRIVPEMLSGARSQDAKEKELSATKLATIVKEDVEPALHDAAPFFAGHARMTMAERSLAFTYKSKERASVFK
ncbi:hypothetical protein Trisim1_000075 [Trichoderma cf. simile WF8]